MKIKIWIDDKNRLLHWAYMNEDRPTGPTEDGQQIIETDNVSQFIDGHASFIDGKIVLDSDYQPPAPPTIPTEPSNTELKDQVDMMQAALLELADLSLTAKK